MKILLAGGAGYIGSHTAVELISSGHSVIIVDNLSNSSRESVVRIERITNTTIPFYEADVRDKKALRKIFEEHTPDGVIHFAGLKAVGESVDKPLSYYENNLDSTLSLLNIMQEFDVYKLVFSSSATVYGTSSDLPLTENSPVGIGITNPYGWTKYMIEQILQDTGAANSSWQITILRYFNPIGAHKSGLIGEDPRGIPNNLLPYISQTAVGIRDHVNIFGNDYDTPDGTGIRDYIHVVDLAKGHVAAMKHAANGVSIYNLGTGKGTSVLEIINAFKKASGRDIPYKITDRRPGDIGECYASADKARIELDWSAKESIETACRDSWHWQSQNPNGFTR